MPQPETFISISYDTFDFLLPKDGFSCVAADESYAAADMAAGYDLDELARTFSANIPKSSVRTLLLLNKGGEQLAFMTSCQCKVCTIALENFSVFADRYEAGMLQRGIIACRFTERGISYLLDIKKFVSYRNGARKVP